MNLQIGRRLFILLIALHSRSFQGDFGREMLLTYDEASEDFSTTWMLWDGWLSFLQQLGTAQLNNNELLSGWRSAGLRSGVYPLIEPSRLTAGQLLLATLLSLMLCALIQPW